MTHIRKFYDSHKNLPIDPDAAQPGVVGRPIHTHPGWMVVVFVGGCLGTLARYTTSMALPTIGDGWPVATLTVNLIGAFILGLLLQALINHGPDQGRRRLIRLGIGTGFLGGFTTYSTFAVESDLMISHSHIGTAITYILASLVGGVLLSTLGIQVATKHHRRRTRTAV